MTLQQLRYLLGIADSGLNITAAAERLYTSQPGISKQLKLLEQELGIQLFTRKGKSLSAITPAGHEVIARARRILLEVKNIRNLASDLSQEQEGTLSIATTHTQARYVLPDVIQKFRDSYPKVNLEIHQGTAEQIAELVSSNSVDFAVASGAQELFPDLVLLPCYEWDRIVLAPQGHNLGRKSEPLSIEILSAYPLVTYVFSLTGESSFRKAFNDKDLEPDVVFTARDADIIKTYVRMGMGVGVVAAMSWECQDKNDLVALDATGLFPRITTWIGFRRDTVLRGYMVDFAELFAPHLSPELTQRAASIDNQEDVDKLFEDIELPIRGGCENEFGADK
ncbi:MAG: HTH-type transcriptional regulator CysB [Pseudomonadota bacterium]|nr:HTH-type transcriptional regulator CysB [Pseudomonadota bacterium]